MYTVYVQSFFLLLSWLSNQYWFIYISFLHIIEKSYTNVQSEEITEKRKEKKKEKEKKKREGKKIKKKKHKKKFGTMSDYSPDQIFQQVLTN